jgi:IclR family transcriptional regulator, acetate operon repressor
LLGSHRVYLDQIPSPQEIKMTVEVGSLFPLHAASSSLAILAFAPPDLREQVLSGPLEKLTPKTKVSREELEHSLAEIQSTGVACSFGERQPDTGSVAAPILGIDGYARGSLSVCGPVHRFAKAAVERFAPLVREGAREVSLQLGRPEAVVRASAG